MIDRWEDEPSTDLAVLKAKRSYTNPPVDVLTFASTFRGQPDIVTLYVPDSGLTVGDQFSVKRHFVDGVEISYEINYHKPPVVVV